MSLEIFARQSLAQFAIIYGEIFDGKAIQPSEIETLMWGRMCAKEAGIVKTGLKIPYDNIKRAKVTLPYMPDDINYTGCCAIKKNGGLYTPCCGKVAEDTYYCKSCSVDKEGESKEIEFGAIDDRDQNVEDGRFAPITFAEWMKGHKTTLPEVYAKLRDAGIALEIPANELTCRELPKRRKGRPAKSDDSVVDEDSVPKAKGKKAKTSDDEAPKTKAKKVKEPESESEDEAPKPKAKKVKSPEASEDEAPKVKKVKSPKASPAASEDDAPKAKKVKSPAASEDDAPKAKKVKSPAASEDDAPKAKKVKSPAASEDDAPKKVKKAKAQPEPAPKAKKVKSAEDKAPKPKKVEPEPASKAKKVKSTEDKAPKPKAKKSPAASEDDAPKSKAKKAKVPEPEPEPEPETLEVEEAEEEEFEDQEIEIGDKDYILRNGKFVIDKDDGRIVATVNEDGEPEWVEGEEP